MNMKDYIRYAGFGAYTLYGLTLVILVLHLDRLIILDEWQFEMLIPSLSLFPPALIIIIAIYFSNQMHSLLIKDELLESGKEIKKITGDESMYESANKEVQERVDKFDRLSYRCRVNILSGIFILLFMPSTLFITEGSVGLITGILVGGLSIWLFTYKSFKELANLAESISEPYQAKYEN
jgi:uncharacterized membrane protein (DUF106 family)